MREVAAHLLARLGGQVPRHQVAEVRRAGEALEQGALRAGRGARGEQRRHDQDCATHDRPSSSSRLIVRSENGTELVTVPRSLKRSAPILPANTRWRRSSSLDFSRMRAPAVGRNTTYLVVLADRSTS